MSDLEQQLSAFREESFTSESGQTQTSSGIPVEPLYVPSADARERYAELLGFPGSFPFTRGVYPTMYRGRHWTMRQYSGFGDARETNQRFRALLLPAR